MTRLAIYPGSFDPPTRGHEDLARRSLALCDRLIVAVATNSQKQALFTVEERLDLLKAAIGSDPRITFERFDGLLAEFARTAGATHAQLASRVHGSPSDNPHRPRIS